jgi:hypothetical protein
VIKSFKKAKVFSEETLDAFSAAAGFTSGLPPAEEPNDWPAVMEAEEPMAAVEAPQAAQEAAPVAAKVIRCARSAESMESTWLRV